QGQEGGDQQHRDESVVGVGEQGVGGVGVGGPGEGEGRGQLVAPGAGADAAAEEDQQGEGGEIEEDGGTVGGGEVVPGSRPGPDSLEGNVGEVIERAVGIALGDVFGEVVVDRFAVDDAAGADLAGVADVDHTR